MMRVPTLLLTLACLLLIDARFQTVQVRVYVNCRGLPVQGVKVMLKADTVDEDDGIQELDSKYTAHDGHREMFSEYSGDDDVVPFIKMSHECNGRVYNIENITFKGNMWCRIIVNLEADPRYSNIDCFQAYNGLEIYRQ